MNRSRAYLRICSFYMLVLLVVSSGYALAIPIEPNPNPDGNTITITPSTPRENLVPFTNLGFINIETAASLHNGNRLDNSGVISSAGTITNSGVVNNNRVGISVLEGSQFTNLSSGLYNGLGGGIGIGGTFINEGTVTHNLGHIVVEETGQYIQRQAVGSSVTPTTITPDAPFTNAGRVHIAAGDFNVDPISIRAASSRYEQTSTGTTQIDARFQNIGGQVYNAGAITIGSTGEYRQQGFPGLILAGSTSNTGTLTNAGTTNIATGTFTNQGSVANSGTFTVGTNGQYLQEPPPASGVPAATTANSGTFSNAGAVRIGEGTAFNNVSNRGFPVGQYLQLTGGATQINGTFQIGGARVENAGAMTVGTTGTYLQAFNKFVPVVSTTANTGTFTNAGNALINAGTFTNQGSVVNSGTFQVAVNGAATLANQGTVVNAGTFEIGNLGQVSGTGSYVQNAAAAQTIVNGTFAHNITLQAGTLTGTGTIQGSVQNSGGLLLLGNNGLGTLTIKGQYAQGFGGTFGVNLAGLNSYGLLAVQGTGAAVTLGGSLKVGLINGFSPALGNTFGVLTCTGCTISGGLQSLTLPTLASGLGWSVGFVNGLGMLQLAVVSTPTASAPEPGTFLLVGAGFVSLVVWRWKQIRTRSAPRAGL